MVTAMPRRSASLTLSKMDILRGASDDVSQIVTEGAQNDSVTISEDAVSLSCQAGS